MISKHLSAIITIVSALLTCATAYPTNSTMIVGDLVLVAATGVGISDYLRAYEMLESLVNLACFSETALEERSQCLEAQDILKEAEAELDRDSRESFESDCTGGVPMHADEVGWFDSIYE